MVGAERGISPAIWDLAWLLSSGILEMCSLTSYFRGFSEKGVVLTGLSVGNGSRTVQLDSTPYLPTESP